MKVFLKILLAALLSGVPLAGICQFALVNIDTVMYYGTTDTLDYMPVQINTNGDVVIAGNQKMSSTQYDAMTAAESVNAVNLWIDSYNPSTDKAFIVASTHDQAGNIYNVGAVRQSSTNSLDFLVIKYDAGGSQQWVYTYNGPDGLNDVACGITLDPAGELYVTGTSDGLGTGPDYTTIKLDANGNEIWTVRYDHNNVFDIPAAVYYDQVNNSLVVTGSSGSSFTDWDFATVEYDPGSGQQLVETRISNAGGVGQDKAFALAADSLGNVYVTGTTYNGSNYDVQVVKLDQNLNAVWTRTLDLGGFDDAGLSVALDDSLNLYFTGFGSRSASEKEMFLFKYSNNGTFRWKGSFMNGINMSSEGLRVKVKSGKEIFVGGNLTQNGNQDIVLMRFNEKGKLDLFTTYDGQSGGKDQFMDMVYEGSKLFVTARSFNGTNDDNILIHYSYKDQTIHPDTGSISGLSMCKGQLLVHFEKSAMRMNVVDNTRFRFGVLGDFINDSTCDKITNVIDPEGILRIEAKNLPTQKVFLNMTSADSVTTARTGELVRVPEFYCTLLIDFPANLDPEIVGPNIMRIKPDIDYTGPNYLYELNWVPNDSLYALQTSLHASTIFPNAHINCEPAWDYTKGEPHVRVGVYDTGINKNHVDLTVAQEAGYYTAQTPLHDYMKHGTKVAGVIAARSNNTVGVSGIAGGSGQAGTGISLYNVQVFDHFLAPTSFLEYAYKDGADGKAFWNMLPLHVMNHSYGITNLAFDINLARGIDYCNKLGVAFVVARGNHYATATHSISAYSAPATMKAGKVMNVGATGTDGHYHKEGVNGSHFSSMHSRDVDFVAPGDTANVLSTDPSYPSTDPWKVSGLNASYSYFKGTSAAAPHVSGVVGLMMSYRNSPTPAWDNIVHEDVEAILKMSSTDLASATYSETFGADFVTGHGRINADSALACLQPKYQIRHIDANHHSTSTSVTTAVIANNVLRYWPGSGLKAADWYITDVTQITTQYTYPFSSEQFIAAWPLYKNSEGVPAPLNDTLVNTENMHVEVISATNSSAILRTYSYKLISAASNTNVVFNIEIPWPVPGSYNSAFTLYTLGEEPIVTNVKREEETVKYFNLYPNPATANCTIGFPANDSRSFSIDIYDLSGRRTGSTFNGRTKQGLNRMELDTRALEPGIYFVTLDVQGNRRISRKLIVK